MRSKHGNSLYFISRAVDYFYNNFPKSPFSLQQPAKKVVFLYKNISKKIKPVRARRANVPTSDK